jgi:hypothetical protein
MIHAKCGRTVFLAGFAAGSAAGFAGKCRVFLGRSGIVRGNFLAWSDRYSGIPSGSATAAIAAITLFGDVVRHGLFFVI